MFACGGILFNHESPRRGETFVTRKIANAAARIKRGLQDKLYMGNLDARRDWGYAPEYVEAMWLMLQQDEPDDYVIGTGEMHTVREFLELSFAHLNLDWRDHVETDPRYLQARRGGSAAGRSVESKQPSELEPPRRLPRTGQADGGRGAGATEMTAACDESSLAPDGSGRSWLSASPLRERKRKLCGVCTTILKARQERSLRLTTS